MEERINKGTVVCGLGKCNPSFKSFSPPVSAFIKGLRKGTEKKGKKRKKLCRVAIQLNNFLSPILELLEITTLHHTSTPFHKSPTSISIGTPYSFLSTLSPYLPGLAHTRTHIHAHYRSTIYIHPYSSPYVHFKLSMG